jgi:hypothetical protein
MREDYDTAKEPEAPAKPSTSDAKKRSSKKKKADPAPEASEGDKGQLNLGTESEDNDV